MTMGRSAKSTAIDVSLTLVVLFLLQLHHLRVPGVASLRPGWSSSTVFARQLNRWRRRSSSILRASATTDDETQQEELADFHSSPPFEYTAEVVGSTGRMGSFWLISHRPPQDDDNPSQQHFSSAIACPRGISPGCLSKANSPIYVATPSAAWKQIYHETVPSRRRDLCFVGNGIPQNEFANCTIVVPHFAVLQICRDSHGVTEQTTNNIVTPPIQTSPQSPPTFLYGLHANSMAAILQAHGVETKIVESFQDIVIYSGLKLLWASCMWLLCHSRTVDEKTATMSEYDDADGGGAPMTVGEVHERRQVLLDRLVDELFPVLQEMIGDVVKLSAGDSRTAASASRLTRQYVDEYLRDYSNSISHAIPSKSLALSEFSERNGIFFRRSQKFHSQLLKEHLSDSMLEHVESDELDLLSGGDECERIGVDLNEVGLKAWGIRRQPLSEEKKRVVVVGGGMIGSSLALSLARRRPEWDITVIDENPDQDMGKTTNASWAWINANTKIPKSYQIFNQLGIHAWKHHPKLHRLVSWMGSLVRFTHFPDFVNDGGYPLQGPLTGSTIKHLEPLADFGANDGDGNGHNSTGFTFLFPDEGCVEPAAAVEILRKTARDHGVEILCGQNVTNVVYDNEKGTVIAVESIPTDSKASTSSETTTTPADLVVAAAGCGLSMPFLGGVPLLHRPGRIEYGRLNASGNEAQGTHSMRRILVDAERSCHVLQRRNGDIVAGGGGRLEFGGTDVSGGSNEKAQEDVSQLRLARQLAPTLISNTVFTKGSFAVRPMPYDGFPVIGYQNNSGLYNVVTHSGITLGLLLSEFAAAEITESVSFEILHPYRPSRFNK